MGSCFSKPSTKGEKKKQKQNLSTEEENKEGLEKSKASEAVEKEASQVTACLTASSSSFVENPQALSAPSQPSLIEAPAFTGLHKTDPPPASPLLKKPSPFPSLSPDLVIVPPNGQTPLNKKLSGDFTINPLRKPSSPCKSLPHMPPSPGLKRHTQKNTDDEYKFPSLAAKQWLSQTHVSSANKGASNVARENKLVSTEAPSLASKKTGVQASLQTSKECDLKATDEAPNLTVKTMASRTNSFSRDLSPVEPSRAKARPSSPLKRSPSIKDSAADGPRLTRSSSAKVSSPHRSGLHSAERQDSMKARPLHKPNLSKELLADSTNDRSVHKHTSSRDSMSEFSAEIIRKPSPPKKAPGVVPSLISLSSTETNRLTAKRPSTPSKDNLSLHRSINQEPSSRTRAVKTSAQKSLSAAVNEPDNTATGNNNRTTKRKEKSPLRRSSNGVPVLHSNTRLADRNADVSINSDTTAASHFNLLGKDAVNKLANKSRKLATRVPLEEILDNSANQQNTVLSKQRAKENGNTALKPKEGMLVQNENDVDGLLEEVTKSYEPLGNCTDDDMVDIGSNFTQFVKDPLEVKAENLVMGGKSVLGAFKALEEYRLKYSNIIRESSKGGEEDEDVSYTWHPPYSDETQKESLSQPLQEGETIEKFHCRTNIQQPQDPVRSRSTKKSCEQFLFPDVQSLLMSSENGRMQLEGGMAMPASITKACSILRAVADLNMGTVTYSNKREPRDEIERPNFLTFQFGEGDSHRVTSSS